MDSIALYRRWRPQTFSDLVGQEPVAGALQGAIREGRVAHAYLFSGPRGTGKTSTARILAKALNCELGPTPEPCNKCDACRSITEGSSLDVIEIDAASHGGVDDVRELRESVILSPAVARKKIYIVDEAHMISTAGWNAFLKTIEEPPDHVVFVFATTEPQKVLPTIASRCQRFDFRRISSASIAEHLEKVCREERIEADGAALNLIARHADGSARDALAVLDQLASAGGVGVEEAAALLGSVPQDVLFDFAEALATRETGPALRAVATVVDEGRDVRAFTTQMLQHLRSLFVVQRVPDAADLIDATDEVRARLTAQAERFGAAHLVHLMRLLAGALEEMRQQAVPRLALEMAVIAGSVPEADASQEAALSRIERLERLLSVGQSEGVEERKSEPVTEPQRDEARSRRSRVASDQGEKAAAAAKVSAPETSDAVERAALDLEKVRKSWTIVLDGLRTQSMRVAAYLVDTRPVQLDGNVLTLETSSQWHAEQIASGKTADVLGAAFEAVFGSRPRFKATVGARRSKKDPEPEPIEASDEPAQEEPAPKAAKPKAKKSSDVDAVEALKRELGAEVIED